MASVRSTIDLIITGATRGLAAASAEAEAMAERVSRAEDRVSAARTRSAAAEDRVGVAERRLQDARSGQEAALSRIGVAETNLDRVRENSNGATTRLAQAQAELDRVRNTGGASAERIAQAEAHVTQVRQESDREAAALQRAEAALATARANGERAGGRVAAAEAALARARSNNVRASEASARAENDLNNLRRRGNQDVDTQRSGILGLFDAFSRLGNALTGADDASNRFLSSAGALQGIFSQIGGPIVQTVVGLLQLVAVLATAGEIIGVVGGTIGQVLAGAIPVVLALAAAAGTVALGMDGIKKAAEAAAPAFEKLKAAVSSTFQQQLTPVFKQLALDIPKLTANFQDIAAAVASVGSKLVGVISSTAGMERLQLVLAGTADFVLALGNGLARFLDGLIRVGAAAAPVMAQLGAAFSTVFTEIGNVLGRLAGDGTIAKAIQGLSSLIIGLGNVLGPVIDLLIQMGAALGNSLGTSLTEIGNGIRDLIPFFVHLAQVAGDVLKAAFEQLGPPIARLVQSILPGANKGLDGFATAMTQTVLPAIGHFIDFLRTDGIPAFIAFTEAIIINGTAAVSSFLGFVSGMLGALSTFLRVLGTATGNEGLIRLSGQIDEAKKSVDGLKTTVDSVHDKTVAVAANVTGAQAVEGIKTAIDGVKDKVVKTVSNVFGLQENKDLTTGIVAVPNKTVTTTSNVPEGPNLGTLGNKTLTGAIGAVIDKTTVTTGKVPEGPTLGTLGNRTLTSAIGAVPNKTVTVTANVNGTGAVRGLIDTINAVHDKTVTVTSVVRNIVRAGFATGGHAPGGEPILVGERGPEILTLPRSGMITNAERSKQIAGGMLGGGGPITVNVAISQDAIAGIAEVVIQRRDRTTKRTVMAGSGVTF